MEEVPWFIAIGFILIFLALTSSRISRLPLSTSIVCLLIGIAIGPSWIGLLQVDLIRDASLIEELSEIAILVSLFAVGLQLRLPFSQKEWSVSIRLATVGMVVTIMLITGVGWALGFPLGASIILGAVLAPTDPVLASDVQIKNSMDSDPLRFLLTCEGGLNDGTAFPFLMLGLGLLGLHELGTGGWHWLTVDVLWAVTIGLTVGGMLGTLIGRVVLYLRLRHHEAIGLDNFLAVGLIALSYGFALYANSYGFLAVFAAGVALRHVERTANTSKPSESIRAAAGSKTSEHLATDQETASAYMAEAIVNFNVHLERFAEVTLVILAGSLLQLEMFNGQVAIAVATILLAIRPIAVYLTLLSDRIPSIRKSYIAWFGIRGVGSIYYLSYALKQGFHSAQAETIADIVMATIATSIVIHGISVTPMMNYYSHLTSREV